MYIPLISSFPAATPGPHKTIGYAYARVPCEPYSVDSPTIEGKPALRTNECSFAIYYPSTSADAVSGVSWLPEPTASYVAGYNKFLGGKGKWLMAASDILARRLKMTVALNGKAEKGKYPLILYSHGLAGTRNTYSQVCSALASEGYVVVAVEHKDGSGPCVIYPENREAGAESAEDPMLLFTRSTNLEWPEGKALELMDFRVLQLRMRVHEMLQAYKSFKTLMSGAVVPRDMSAEQASAFAETLRDSVDVSSVVLAGHSFGGATCLRAYDKMPVPVTHILGLDPWFEPLILGEKKYGFEWPKAPPTLVINSQGFTEWKEVWPGEKRICSIIGATLVTIGGLGHQGFSDFPLVTSWPSTAFGNLALIHKLCMAELNDDLPELLKKIAKREVFKEGILEGAAGEVILHDTPSHEAASQDPTPSSPELRLQRTLSNQSREGEPSAVPTEDLA